MRLVIDTNILFSFFRKDSTTRNLISRFEIFELFAPSFCIEELLKYKQLICKKAGISEETFKKVLEELNIFVKIVPLNEYSKFLPKAKSICPDPDDIDFFALALKLNCPIWSNDTKLKKQSAIKVFSTRELMKLLL